MKLSFFDIIDINNSFDLLILKVIAAREDFRKSTLIMERVQNEAGFMFFMFKIKVGFINESKLLFKELFSSEWRSYLKQLPNYEKISELKQQLDENKNINKEAIRNIRNFTFHYKETKDLKKLFQDSNSKDFVAEFEIGEKRKDVYYQFIDEVYIQMLSKFYYNEFDSQISTEKIEDMITEVADFGRQHMEILEAVIESFLESKFTGNV